MIMAIAKIPSMSLHETHVLSRSYTDLYLVRSQRLVMSTGNFFLAFSFLEDWTKSMPSFLTYFIVSVIKTDICYCYWQHRSLNVLYIICLSFIWEVHKVKKKSVEKEKKEG